MIDLIKEEDISSLDELNKKLYNLNEKCFGKYVFRGHSDKDYLLLPSLLRDVTGVKTEGLLFTEELKTLIKFYRECNNQGLKIKKIKKFDDTYMSDYFSLTYVMDDTFYWLDDKILELAALAQHYGLKTRLLDWTQDVRVALYFSCIGADTSKLSDKCSIWAINADYIQQMKNRQEDSTGLAVRVAVNHKTEVGYKWIYEAYDKSIPLKFYTPSYSENPNLNAQKGILSIWQYNLFDGIDTIDSKLLEDKEIFNKKASDVISKKLNSPVNNNTIDYWLNNYFSSHSDEECDYEKYQKDTKLFLLYKINFPKNIVDDLKKQLIREGYTSARLFPGYNGVVKYLKDGI